MRSASQSGFRTVGSGSRAPKARSAATTIEVRDGWPGPKGAESKLAGIFVDTFSDFFTEPACSDVLYQEGAWTIFFAQRLMQKIEDTQPRIESHHIDHFKRPHRMVQSEL